MTYITTGLVLLVVITSGWITTVGASNSTIIPITYVSYIDDRLGFYKVVDDTLHKDSQYKERILTINQGDTIIWLNDADTAILTVVSEQNLWDKTRSKLGSTSRRFNYTFMIPGTYSVCVDRYKDIVCQTIIVNPVEGYPTPTPTSTPSPTPSPVYTQTKTNVKTPKAVPNDTIYIGIDMNKSKNYTVNSANNETSEKGTDSSSDISWVIIINFINAITGLLVATSALLITYKILRDY